MSPVLPDNLLRLMSAEDRRALGKGGQTASEAQRKWQRGEERKLHEGLAQWLRLRGIPHVHGRMDKASTIRKGWPDFTALYGGRAACVELKAPGGRLSAEQEEVLSELAAASVPATVATTLEEAIAFLKAELDLGKA